MTVNRNLRYYKATLQPEHVISASILIARIPHLLIEGRCWSLQCKIERVLLVCFGVSTGCTPGLVNLDIGHDG
jgi:hypothetical protein